MKRIMLVLTVVLVMAALMVVAAPAAMAQIGPGGAKQLCDDLIPGSHPEGAVPVNLNLDPGIERVVHLCGF